MQFKQLIKQPIIFTLARIFKALAGADNPTIGSTAITGAYAALTSAPASRISILNSTGADVLVTYGGTGAALKIKDGVGMTLPVSANASELSAKTADSSSQTLTYLVELI